MNSDYLEQVSCSNKQMLNIAAEVISDDPEAIIVFASDHGWKFNHAIPEQVAETGLSDSQLSDIFRYTNFISVRAPKGCFAISNEVYYLGDIFPDIIDCLNIDVDKPFLRNFGSYRFNADTKEFKPVDVNALMRSINRN